MLRSSIVRGADVLSLLDEDLEHIGFDPKKISDQQFLTVVNRLKTYYNNGFYDVLSEMLSDLD